MGKRRELELALESSKRTNEILLEIVRRQEARLSDLLDRLMAQDFSRYKEMQINTMEPLVEDTSSKDYLEEELAGEVINDL